MIQIPLPPTDSGCVPVVQSISNFRTWYQSSEDDPYAKLYLIVRSGHLPYLEDADEFNRLVLDSLKD